MRQDRREDEGFVEEKKKRGGWVGAHAHSMAQ